MHSPRSLVVAILVAVIAGCSPDARQEHRADTAMAADSSSHAAAAPAWVVSEYGIGPIRAGMTLGAVGQLLDETFRADSTTADHPCTYVSPRGLPAGTSLMVVSDTVMRVDVDSTLVATAEGIRVGAPEADVVARYAGRVRVQPHKYIEGHYLVVAPTAAVDSGFGLVFETDGRRVLNYRAGRRPEVEWVEGCS